MKKLITALAAVATLAAAVPASAEYLHVTGNQAYSGGIGLPNDGSIPYETGPWVKIGVPNLFGQYYENKYTVDAGDTVAYSKYYFPINTLGSPGDQDTWYEYVIPAGYDLRLHFAGTLFNPTLDAWIVPTTDTTSPNYVDPNPAPKPPVEKYVKPTPTGEQWLDWLDDLRNTNTNNLTIFGN